MDKNIRNIGEIKAIDKIIPLDKKNQKILSLLMLNARTQNSQLAKIVELSKSNIARRISILEDKGLITGYHAFIDITKLNLKYCAILMKTRCTEEEKEEYLKKITSNPWVYSILELTGKYNLLFTFYYKDEDHKNKLIEEILEESLMKDFYTFNFTTIFPRLDYTNQKIYSENIGEYSKEFQEKKEFKKPNKIDIKLIRLLSENSRLTLVDLAEKLNISRETINYRIKRLISGRVIAKFQPTINFFLLGFESYMLNLKISKPTQKKKIIDYLSNTGRSNTILKTDGNWDIITPIHFQNNKEFRIFEKALSDKFKDSIYEYSFEIAKEQYKLNWFSKELEKELLKDY